MGLASLKGWLSMSTEPKGGSTNDPSHHGIHPYRSGSSNPDLTIFQLCVWPRTHCFFLMSPSEMEIITPILKVKVKTQYGQCTQHSQAWRNTWDTLVPSLLFQHISLTSLQPPVYLSKTIVFLLLLPNPRLKQEMQRSILSKSVGKGFSTFFSLSSLSKSF